VHQERRVVHQPVVNLAGQPCIALGVYLRQSSFVVLWKFDFLPPFCRRVHSFCGFHVEIQDPTLFADGRIFGEKRAGLSWAKTGDIVFVATETLSFRSIKISLGNNRQGGRMYLTLNEQKSWFTTFQINSSEFIGEAREESEDLIDLPWWLIDWSIFYFFFRSRKWRLILWARPLTTYNFCRSSRERRSWSLLPKLQWHLKYGL